MQVSWIDPEEIQAFLAQLQGPVKAPAELAWEVHTLPVQPLPAPTAQPIIGPPEIQQPASAPPPRFVPPAIPDMPLGDSRPGPVKGEIWSIREQLRTLREKAEESGIVPTATVDPVFVEHPGPEPVIEPAPPAFETPPSAEESISVEALLAMEAAELIDSTKEIEVLAEIEATSEIEAPSELAPPPLSADARLAMAELLGPAGPQPESPPVTDPNTLPQPLQPPTSPLPPSIEYAGPAPSSVVTEPLFGSSSTSSATPAQSISPEQALEEVVEEPIQPVAASAEMEAPAVEPKADVDSMEFVAPALGLSDRLNALATWAIRRLGTGEVLLVDDYGDVLWGGNQHTALVLAAMMAWHSSQRASAESACSEPQRIDKEINPGRHLTVIPVRTRYGNVSLAAILESVMSEAEAHAVRQALMQAVEGV